jgi:hypothetical protein
MGRRTARFVRVPPDECALLNSRDKSPFMVCIEVSTPQPSLHSTSRASAWGGEGERARG